VRVTPNRVLTLLGVTEKQHYNSKIKNNIKMKRKSFITPLLLLVIGCAVILGGFWAKTNGTTP
jgi:hypothetical protein